MRDLQDLYSQVGVSQYRIARELNRLLVRRLSEGLQPLIRLCRHGGFQGVVVTNHREGVLDNRVQFIRVKLSTSASTAGARRPADW